MPAMIWDETIQAFKEADTPKIWNESAQAFVDAEGKVYNGSEWIDCFKKYKSFTLTVKYNTYVTANSNHGGNTTVPQTTCVYKFDGKNMSLVSVSGGNSEYIKVHGSTTYPKGTLMTVNCTVSNVSLSLINDDNRGTDIDFIATVSPLYHCFVTSYDPTDFGRAVEGYDNPARGSLQIRRQNGALSYTKAQDSSSANTSYNNSLLGYEIYPRVYSNANVTSFQIIK